METDSSLNERKNFHENGITCNAEQRDKPTSKKILIYNTMNKRLRRQSIFILCNSLFNFDINFFMLYYFLYNVLF